MKCIEQLRADLDAVGASLDADDYTLNLDAKPGYVWKENGCSCLVVPYATNSQQWAAQAVKEARARAAQGMELCDADQSAEIEYSRDEPWTADASAPATINFPAI